jgi:hypothetical protein
MSRSLAHTFGWKHCLIAMVGKDIRRRHQLANRLGYRDRDPGYILFPLSSFVRTLTVRNDVTLIRLQVFLFQDVTLIFWCRHDGER